MLRIAGTTAVSKRNNEYINMSEWNNAEGRVVRKNSSTDMYTLNVDGIYQGIGLIELHRDKIWDATCTLQCCRDARRCYEEENGPL